MASIQDICSDDVAVWLNHHAHHEGLPGLELHVYTVRLGSDREVRFMATHPSTPYIGAGNTVHSAIAELRAHLKSPEKLAEEKRAMAAKLMADAEALCPTR